PVLILVHVASTNVPFTSESKDAIASIPEIEREITLALQELGRDLKTFLSRRDKSRLSEERARAICAIIPEIATKVAETIEKPVPDITPIEGQIMRRLVAKKWTDNGAVNVSIQNYTSHALDLTLYIITADDVSTADPPAVFVEEMGTDKSAVWQMQLAGGENWQLRYTGTGNGMIDIRGVDEKKKVVVDLDRS
ncbi:MAG: DNA topoisomerase VI subunit B, partial [Methanospirillum hungatei]|nr:DNA topoisomerase VI subunit B [Methanospirillum hungatei]